MSTTPPEYRLPVWDQLAKDLGTRKPKPRKHNLKCQTCGRSLTTPAHRALGCDWPWLTGSSDPNRTTSIR